jgi:aryl-alcohol dehydrogenase-like predicted oxidoreductase
MEYRRLGQTDLEVSSIGLGCVTFGREIDEETSFAVMDRAVDRGINLFDTAEAYSAGGSEEVVGRWLKATGRRAEVVLATKVAGTLDRKRILSSAEASLRRLQTDRIDLFQVHHWSDKVPLEETLEALDQLVGQGKIRYIGCSNYTAAQLEQALDLQNDKGWATMASVQPNYSLVMREIEDELLPLCRRRHVGIISYSPLGAGFLTGKYRKGGAIPEGTRFDVIPDHQDIYFHDEKFRIMEGLRTIAQEQDVPMAQLALAWVLHQPGVTSVLIGGRKVEHIEQAFAAESMAYPAELQQKLNRL